MRGDGWDDRLDELEYRPTRTAAKGVVHAWIVVLIVIALAVVTGAILWFGRVATSDVKGRGDAEIIKNEARNRIRAQEGFWDKLVAVEVADKNLTLTAEALIKQPDSVKLQTELTGQKMICNDAVGAYNAAARKFTQQDYRDADMPEQVDQTDPAYDCKESK